METNETILTREIVSLDDRKRIGRMKEQCVDCDTLAVSHYVVNSESTNTPLVLPFDKALAVGDTFVTIQSRDDLLATGDPHAANVLKDGFRLVGVEVFSRTGNRLGLVDGYEFDPVFGTVLKVSVDKQKEFSADAFIFFASDFIFVDDGEATAAELRAGGNDEATEKAVEEEPDNEAPKEAPLSENEATQPSLEEQEGEDAATQGQADIDEDEVLKEFLVDAVVSEDVVSKDGAFKVSQGTTLTKELIEEAQTHDALLLLTMSVEA